MEKKIFEQLFEKEYKIAAGRLEEAKKVEEYYKELKEDGERYRHAKCNRIKYATLVDILEELIDLPLVHQIRYASDAELEELKKQKINEFKREEYSIEVAIDNIKAEIKDLENEERINIFEPDESKKTTQGKKINEEINKKREKLRKNKTQLGNIRNEIKHLEGLSYPALRELLIDIIPNSDSIVGIESYALSKESDYKLFEKVAENPVEVEKLVELIKGLITAIGTDNENAFKYDKYKIDRLVIPDDLKEKIFDNGSVYSKVDCSFDPVLAHEIADKYDDNYKFEKDRFEGFYDLFKIVSSHLEMLEEMERQLELYPHFLNEDDIFLTPDERKVKEFFSTSHYADLKSFFDKLLEVSYSIYSEYDLTAEEVNDLKEKESLLKSIEHNPFRRKKKDKLKDEICKLQLNIFREIRKCLQYKFLDEFKLIPTQKYLLDYIKHGDIYDLDKTKDNVNTYSDNIDGLLTELNQMREIDRIAKEKIDEILKQFDCKSIDKQSLVVENNYDSIVDHIYECAALCSVCKTIHESEYAAQCLAFEEEARLRHMSESELGVKKLEEERAFITDSYEKVLAFKRKEDQKRKKIENL